VNPCCPLAQSVLCYLKYLVHLAGPGSLADLDYLECLAVHQDQPGQVGLFVLDDLLILAGLERLAAQ